MIEEYALGPTVNLNFFYSPLLGELELLGTDTRRQTNLDGLRALPFAQAQQLADEPVRMEEAGPYRDHAHRVDARASLRHGRTVRARDAGGRSAGHDRTLRAAVRDRRRAAEAFVCYDVSLRIPGSPGTRYTPYGAYRWGRDISVGERIAREVVMARDAVAARRGLLTHRTRAAERS